MALIQENVCLKTYNTFNIDAMAARFASVNTVDKLRSILTYEKDVFILGGGSNLLITSNIERLVLHIAFRGISAEHVGENGVLVTCQAGENWHEFVLWCISNDYGGLENLSLIPGNTGACPIQNIGAFGVEVKDCIHEIETVEIETGQIIKFSNADCEFGYRNSIFKNSLKEKFVITSVTFQLTRHVHSINISHDSICNELRNRGICNPSLRNIGDIVMDIRKRKLPDPKQLGNSGSFFKNPIISGKCLKVLHQIYPNMPHYLQPTILHGNIQGQVTNELITPQTKFSEDKFKVSAAWLIERCGFKGKRFGDAGVHKTHALVVVNHGVATGKEIHRLANIIQDTVLETFGILLEPEVNII